MKYLLLIFMLVSTSFTPKEKMPLVHGPIVKPIEDLVPKLENLEHRLTDLNEKLERL